MAGPSSTRRLGKACRFYKNAAGKLIGTDCISITIDCRQITATKYYFYVDKVNVERKIFHLEGPGGSRIVSSILTMGDYTSITEDSGNFLEVTWAATEPEYNDIVFSLEPHGVAKIGDTI